MVHADASNFATNVSKAAAYEQVLEQAKALFEGQRNWVPLLPLHQCHVTPLTLYRSANTASLLHHALHALPSPSNRVNWAGFYVRDCTAPSQLLLGPFQGKVACQTIAFGKGVCGAAAASKRTQLVPDVEQFPGHIACDGESRSEVVVPVLADGEVVAIIDIDCAELHGFDAEDQKYLERLAALLADSCDW